MRETMIRWASVAILAMALSACGGDDAANVDPAAPSSPPTPPSAVTAVIGPDGGTVNGPDGVQVVIPAGALTQPTTIGIARSSAGAPAVPTDNPPVGSAYEFTPHDLVFHAPVTLRMPVLAGAVGNELFMASPGGDWEVVETVVTGGVAEWQRNTFSWGMLGGVCFVPSGNTDPYPCVYPRGSATAVGTPAGTITRRTFGNFNGSAGSWVINQPGIVKVVANYRAAPDCGINGTGSAGQLKVVRWNPAVFPRVVQTIFDAVVPLTPTPIPPPIGTFSGSATLRGVGSTTVDVTAYLTDPVNAIGVSFACARPGKAVQRGGDLLTFIGSIPPPPGPFTIAGKVSGLTGAGLVLQNNGGDNLPVPVDATSFVFPTSVSNNTAYNVTVLTQPRGETCTVERGSGTATGRVFDVGVVCTSASPASVPLVGTAMAAGSGNSLVVGTDGAVWAWGAWIDPITGGYTSAGPFATEPVRVQGLSGVRGVALSVDSGAFYALHLDGTVSAWGLNNVGQLGDRTTTTRALPVKVMQDATTPMDEVCSIVAGNNMLLMARSTGCSPGLRPVPSGPWIVGLLSSTTIGGDNSGIPGSVDGAIAKLVPGWPIGATVNFMSAPHAGGGAGAAWFMTGRGDRFVWGANGGNLLGAGVATPFAGDATGIVPAVGWSGIFNVQLGTDFSMGLNESSGLVALGANADGQLGIGNTTSSTSQVRVQTLTNNVTSFGLGHNSAAAIVNGELWAWGWNGTAAVTTPTRLGTGTGFTTVVVGEKHSLAIGTGSEIYSWGDPTAGVLGRGGDAATPAVVMRR